MNTLFSIDPGSNKCGYAIINIETGEVLKYGILKSNNKDYYIRMNEICNLIDSILAENKISIVLIEEVFVGNNGRTAITMGKTMGFISRTCKNKEIYFINAVSSRKNIFKTKTYRNKKITKKFVERFVYLKCGIKEDFDTSDAILNGWSFINTCIKQH